MLGKKTPHFVDGRCWRNPHYWINFGKFQHLVHVGTATQHLTNGNMLSKSQQCRYHQPGICSKIRFLPSLGLDLSTSKHSKLVQGLAKTIHNLNVPWTNPGMDQCNALGYWIFPLWFNIISIFIGVPSVNGPLLYPWHSSCYKFLFSLKRVTWYERLSPKR